MLEEVNGQKMLEQKVNNTLFVENSEVGRESTASLKVRNLAVVQVDYFWNYPSQNISVEAKQGKMKPSELLEFKIVLKPTQTTP